MKFLPATVLVAVLIAAAPASAEQLMLQGSTTLSNRLMIPYQREIEELSRQRLVIVPNKSSLGLQALFEKSSQFGMISGPLEVETDLIRKFVPNAPFDRLQVFEVAHTRMAFAVHPDNPVRAITVDKLRRILLGEVRNWRDVGGSDVPLRLVMVREGGGVQASVESHVLNGKKIAAPDPILVQISSQVVKVVMQEPGALGLAQLGVINRAHAPEMKLDFSVEQRLSLVSLGEPTPAMQSVINATREIASKVPE